jgi:hypothetical protein
MPNAKSVMRKKITKAFKPLSRRVPDQRIAVLIDQLTEIGGPATETAPAAFRAIAPISAVRELKLIAHHARELASLLGGMHGTSRQCPA